MLCAALVHASFSEAPLLRFLFAKAVQPLCADIMAWTHDDSLATCPLLNRPSGKATYSAGKRWSEPTMRSSRPQSSIGSSGWMLSASLQLPSFLQSISEAALLGGVQLRFLASLPGATQTVASMVQSAEHQARIMRALARLDTNEPQPVPDTLDTAPVASTVSARGSSDRWVTGILWDAQTARAAARLADGAARERSALADSLLSDLEAARLAAADAQLAERFAALQAAQAEAVAREQEQQAAAEAARLDKLTTLHAQRAELDEHQAQRKVRTGVFVQVFAT